MTHRYGIDTSVFVRLLTGHPESDYQRTVDRFEKRRKSEPDSEYFVSNQVIGEAYVALQHHYRIGKTEARKAMLSVLTSGLCSPLNGTAVLKAIETVQGCGLLDRLIANDYAEREVIVLTHDRKMSRLPGAEKL